jgi:DNA-binding XRE family transcriptional regulator
MTAKFGDKHPKMKGNKYAIGNEGGRPTKQPLDLIKAVDEYLDTCNDGYEKILKDFNGGKEIYEFQFRVALPTVAGLAGSLNVSRETIYAWEKENKEFSDRLGILMAKQEKRLIDMGLSGIYNSNITKLLLTKHGYTDKADITSDGKSLIINFDVPFNPS